MNIFLLDYNPKNCAQYHHDVHLRKMILETFQIIHTARMNNGWPHIPKWIQKEHFHHPAVLWAQHSVNASFLFHLVYHLLEEYQWRFGHQHACLTDLFHTVELMPIVPQYPTDFIQCMPANYKGDSPVLSYRRYYIGTKAFDKNGGRMDVWTRRGQPYWWVAPKLVGGNKNERKEVQAAEKAVPSLEASWVYREDGTRGSNLHHPRTILR